MTAAARRPELAELLRQRILVLDGATGTELQAFGLGEEDYRGARFRDAAKPLKGNHDLLCLTRPDVVAAVHRRYLEAGADLIETNTFSANAISQADYGLAAACRERILACSSSPAKVRRPGEAGQGIQGNTGDETRKRTRNESRQRMQHASCVSRAL